MAENSPPMVPRGLAEFEEYVKDIPTPNDLNYFGACNLVKTVHVDTLKHIKAGRHLLEKPVALQPDEQASFVANESHDVAPQSPEEDEKILSVVGDNSDDSDEHTELGEAYVLVNGRVIAIWEYLGTEWSDHIRALHAVSPWEQPPWCLTAMKPWQLRGAAMLEYLRNSRFHGAILGDEQGLGKTLTTLAASFKAITKENRGGYSGFNLILTTKTCVSQWMDEIKRHFGLDIAARALILEDPSMTANELLEQRPYFVLCTYQFVQSRWRAFEQNRKFYEVVEQLGLQQTLQSILHKQQPDIRRRHINSLFSPVYRALGVSILNLVLDEAHIVKNQDSSTYDAVSHLPYKNVFMLSGTFVKNKWYDSYSLASLLDGHAFKDRTDFLRVFGGRALGGGPADPTPSKRNRLVKFMQAFVISRPATLLKLKPMSKDFHYFQLDQKDAEMVAYHVDLFLTAMRMRDNQGSKQRALCHAGLAQQYCSHPRLLKTQKLSAEDQLRAQGRRLLEQFTAEVRNQQDLMKKLMEWKRNAQPTESNESLDPDQSTTNLPSQDDDDDYDPNDPEWLPDPDDQDEDDEVEPEMPDFDFDMDTGTAFQTTSTLADQRVLWLRKVKNMTIEELLSPKVIAIMNLIRYIHFTWPNEKIAIFSQSLKLLDIVDWTIRRDPGMSQKKVCPLRFDGTCDVDERKRVRKMFESPQSKDIILITPGAGGAGLNLTAGSKIIQCEPWWNAADEDQAYSRQWRLGQPLSVHVWIIRGANSIIDDLMADTKNRKLATNDPIISGLRRRDGEKVIIPRQYKHSVGE